MTQKVGRVVYPDNPLMAIAWRDCLMWAITDDAVRAAFTAKTGIVWPTASGSPIERMIDDATGLHREVVERFIEWFNEWVWGDDPFSPASPLATPSAR